MTSIRYHDSPTGPYDELLIVPGKFEVGEAGKKKEMLRVTRIYVSERGTMWNGIYYSPPLPSWFHSEYFARQGLHCLYLHP